MGISPGVNAAIIEAFEKGILNSTSLMMNVAYTRKAIQLIKTRGKNLSVGIHLNLTNQQNQKPLANPKDISLLVDQNGHLKHGFVGLLLCSVIHGKTFQKQCETEIKAQIEAAQKAGIRLAHLDSHRHVHLIPSIFKVLLKIQKIYHIPRIRVVNESFWHTFLTIRNFACFTDGGFIKYLVLKLFSVLNHYKTDTYFYSILYTTKLYGKNVKKIIVPQKFQKIEICIHPSQIKTDAANWEPAFYDYLLNLPDRQKEFETLLDKDLPNRIV